MNKKNTSKSLANELIRATLPTQMGLIGIIAIVLFGFTIIYSYQQTTSLHQQRAKLFHEHITSQVDGLYQQLEGIAKNDLVLNSIIDIEQRDAYLPLFFQSLRMNNTRNAHVAFVDFNGEIITQRDFDSAILNVYKKRVDELVLSSVKPLIVIDELGLFISVPVVMNGLAEGAIHIYAQHLADVTLAFQSDIYIKAYISSDVSKHSVMLHSMPNNNVLNVNVANMFIYETKIGNWYFVSEQTYLSAFSTLFTLALLTLCVVALAFVGTFIGSRIAANRSAVILRTFKSQLDDVIQNKPSSAPIISRDIIELASIESAFLSVFQQLKQVSLSSQQLNTVINGMREAVVMLDQDNHTIMINDRYEQLLNWSDINVDDLYLLVEELKSLDQVNAISQHKSECTVDKKYHLKKEDRALWVRWYQSSVNTEKYPNATILVGVDITEQHLLQSELLIKNQAIDRANTSIVISDVAKPNCPVIYVNQAFYNLTGYAPEDVLGQNCKFMQGVDTEPEKVNFIREAISHAQPIDITLLNYKANGEPFYNRLMLSPVRNSANIVEHYVGIQRDVTAEKNIRDLLHKAKQKAEDASLLKTNFLASMSHEIRTPINGIFGTIQLLQATELDDKQQRYITLANKSTDKLLSIVDDILDFAKVESGNMELEVHEFDIEKLVHVCIDGFVDLAAQKGLTLRKSVDVSNHKYVLGDAVRLRQILNNLLNNAMKFTHKGHVHVSAYWEDFGQSTQSLCVSVEDSGIGIEKDNHAKVFQQFLQADNSTTRQFGGTGLGLSICRQLCHLMGGEIRLVSKIDVGTTFTVNLPLKIVNKTVKSPRNDKLSVPDLSKSPSHTILVVEDNVLNAEIVCAQLSQFTVLSAENGEVALQCLQGKHHVDLILMDCQMPIMDGYTCTESIRQGLGGEQYKQIPIIALTANAMKGDREKCLQAGMNDYLSKPCPAKDLLTCIETWLSSSADR